MQTVMQTESVGGGSTLNRELKHITNYFDSREMQIRTEFEATQKLDNRIQHNKGLE